MDKAAFAKVLGFATAVATFSSGRPNAKPGLSPTQPTIEVASFFFGPSFSLAPSHRPPFSYP
jgi:hypothetical protein